MADARFCPRCGAPRIPDATFCARCGFDFSGATSGATSPGEAPEATSTVLPPPPEPDEPLPPPPPDPDESLPPPEPDEELEGGRGVAAWSGRQWAIAGGAAAVLLAAVIGIVVALGGGDKSGPSVTVSPTETPILSPSPQVVVPASLAAQGLSISLTWNASQGDVDLHVIDPSGRDIWSESGDFTSSSGGVYHEEDENGVEVVTFSSSAPLGQYAVYTVSGDDIVADGWHVKVFAGSQDEVLFDREFFASPGESTETVEFTVA